MIGRKNATLKKVIKVAKDEGNWKELYSEYLEKLFDRNTGQVGSSLIIEICQKKLKEIKSEFLESLCQATTITLTAGCDIVLHCSEDIEEMRAVCRIN